LILFAKTILISGWFFFAAQKASNLILNMKIFKNLYFYVVVAIITGIILGVYYPQTAISLKFLSDVFIKLIKMMIIPIIFFAPS